MVQPRTLALVAPTEKASIKNSRTYEINMEKRKGTGILNTYGHNMKIYEIDEIYQNPRFVIFISCVHIYILFHAYFGAQDPGPCPKLLRRVAKGPNIGNNYEANMKQI